MTMASLYHTDPTRCSHGNTWKEECPQCDLIWWLNLRDTAQKNLEKASMKIVTLAERLSCDVTIANGQSYCRTCSQTWASSGPYPSCPLASAIDVTK